MAKRWTRRQPGGNVEDVGELMGCQPAGVVDLARRSLRLIRKAGRTNEADQALESGSVRAQEEESDGKTGGPSEEAEAIAKGSRLLRRLFQPAARLNQNCKITPFLYPLPETLTHRAIFYSRSPF